MPETKFHTHRQTTNDTSSKRKVNLIHCLSYHEHVWDSGGKDARVVNVGNRSGQLQAPGYEPWYLLDRRPCEPQSPNGNKSNKKISCPWIKPWSSRHILVLYKYVNA
jgi:hypothetical protein